MKEIQVTLTNIKCEGCVKKIKKLVKKEKDFVITYVDPETKVATINYDESKISSSDINLILKKIGYM